MLHRDLRAHRVPLNFNECNTYKETTCKEILRFSTLLKKTYPLPRETRLRNFIFRQINCCTRPAYFITSVSTNDTNNIHVRSIQSILYRGIASSRFPVPFDEKIPDWIKPIITDDDISSSRAEEIVARGRRREVTVPFDKILARSRNWFRARDG